MIPTLSINTTLQPAYRHFLTALQQQRFMGEIARDYASRLTMATDNGIFQQIPQAVLFPRDEDDLSRIMTLAGREEHRQVRLAPRGGGTSTIGCSITPGIMVDCSRHMNNILEIDIERRQVRVQPGVVLDQLNDTLAGHGFFFAPNVAPSSRATLGGMANTDGCGKGSRVYGKTSDHVLASRLVLSDGSLHEAAPVDAKELAALQRRDDLTGQIHREVDAVIREHHDRIEAVFPKLQRYLSGYNLAQIYDSEQELFNLNKLICGSEGTLAIVAELTLKLTPLPAAKTLFALRYRSFDDALNDAEKLVTFQPSAIESLDDNLMGLARNNPIYDRVRDYIEEPDGSTPAAVNLVEFSAAPGHELDVIMTPFQTFLEQNTGNGGESRATGFYRADNDSAQKALWDLRKGGVGLLGSKAGKRKPLPFVEDTVVDPAVLADYVRDFRAILDAHGLEYGMFGHIDVGCLHVRPALDLCDPEDERILREVMDQVEALVRRYGGLVWNEHGKGFRSQYNPDYFGPELYAALGRVKRAFDPHNQINPGKIVALQDGPPLASMDAATRGSFDRQIDPHVREAYATTVACNGNGACFSYDPREVMCPSYRVTRNRLHSPKGRATVMREWLRQNSLQHFDPTRERTRPRSLLRRALADAGKALRRSRERGADDFSHEVWEAMDGCLSCRACASQCPIKVDVPDFKTRFLSLYHERYPHPLSDYAIASLEPVIAAMARVPGLYNTLCRSRLGRGNIARWMGLSDMPGLSHPSVDDFLRAQPEHAFTQQRYWALGAALQGRCVFIVQDAFTTFFDTGVVVSVVRLLKRLGYHPMVLPYRANGKPLQVKGFGTEFERVATCQARWLTDIARLGPPLVGIEPSVTLTYREEYPAILGAEAVPFEVQLLEEWLAGEMADNRAATVKSGEAPHYTLFQHCTLSANRPASAKAWKAIFDSLGLSLTPAHVGCCGMSGSYGHEARHQTESKGIFSLSWVEALDAARREGEVVVPGYSCRSQIRRLQQTAAWHPAQALLGHLETQSTQGRVELEQV